MANDYVSVANLKAELPDVTFGSTYDTLLGLIATQTSRMIDAVCGVEAGYFKAGTAAARYFTGDERAQLWLPIPMAAAPTTVAVAETGIVDNAAGTGGSYTTWSTSDYLLYPYNASAEGLPYIRLDIDLLNGSKSTWYSYPKGIKITAQWGYATTVPDRVYRAALIEGVRMFKASMRGQQSTGAAPAALGREAMIKGLDGLSKLLLAEWLGPRL